MTNVQQSLRRRTWMILLAAAVAFVLTPSLVHAQFASQTVCTSGVVDSEDDGYDGGFSNDVEQTVCLSYDAQSGIIDSYVETDNDYSVDFSADYGNDNLQTFGVGAEAQLVGFDDNQNSYVVADTGMIYSGTDWSGAQSISAPIDYTQPPYAAYMLQGYYSECGSGDPSSCGWSYNSGLSLSLNQSPTLSLTSSGTPSAPGQPVTFTAILSVGDTGGEVDFNDDFLGNIGSGTFNGTTATFTTNTLFSGSHAISAYYHGDPNYNSASSNTITQVVTGTFTPMTPTLSLSSCCTPSTYGQDVTIWAYISAREVNGEGLDFYANGTYIGSATIYNNYAAFTINTPIPDTYSITAYYHGDQYYTAATSAPFTQVVTQFGFISCTPNTVTQGEYVFVLCTATEGIPMADIVIFTGGANGGYYLVGGSASSYVYAFAMPAGSYNVVASFYGSAGFETSASTTVTILPQMGTETISLATSGTPSIVGQPVTFTATISPSGATGMETFKVDGRDIAESTIINGNTATYTTSALALGTHTVTASYYGDSNYGAATSNTITQVTAVIPGGNPQPSISSVTSEASVGAIVIITGNNFGNMAGVITIAGVPAPQVLWTNNVITVTVPSGVAQGTATIIVTTSGQLSTSSSLAILPSSQFGSCPVI